MDWLTSIKDIRRAQENNQLVVFVGAGVSKNSNVPTWWELIKRIADEIKYDRCDSCSCRDKGKVCPDENCTNRYAFTQDEFLRIPEYFYQKNKDDNAKEYYELIQTTLRGGTGSNPIDNEIFNLLPHHIITTNYDSLLEDSPAINSNLYAVVSRDSDLLAKSNSRYIIKMHGDLEKKETIVLKESDYIDYEQKHPLISTFIRSLLVNHTFVFLGYSLNDYNLNLIIGWINYFRKFHGVENSPANYLVDSKPATDLEKVRLEDKNIFVVDLNSMPSDIETTITIPDDLTNPVGRKLYSYLKCISTPKITQKYIPLEELLAEKYEVLKSYSKISYQDLISVYPLGRTTFMDTELVFYEKDWYERVSQILDNPDSPVTKTFCRAGISAIHYFEDDSSKAVPNAYEPIDEIFQLYFDNDYAQLDKKVTGCSEPIQKLYYFHLLGKNKEDLENILKEIPEKYKANDPVEIILQKTRHRTSLLTFFERQEEKTQELQRLFDTASEKLQKATSFLKMLLNSDAKNKQAMEKLLEKVEKRYEYHSNTFYSGHPHQNLWELKSFAYDYYFFFIENGIPLHYFSDSKEYLSYYLKSILCTYSPNNKNSRGGFLEFKVKHPHYVLNEIDLDMMVKYTDLKSLKSWLKKYSVQELDFEDEIDIVAKYINLCNSIARYKKEPWVNMIHCFTVLLNIIKIDNHSKIKIYDALCNLMENLIDEAPDMIEDLFESLEYVVMHISIDNPAEMYERIIKIILNPKVYDSLSHNCYSALNRVINKIGELESESIRALITTDTDSIADIKDKCKKAFMFRSILTEKYCKDLFNENLNILDTEEIFHLLVAKRLDYSEQCWLPFKESISSLAKTREKQPGIRTYPDWLKMNIEYCLVLKLFGFDVNLQDLMPYAQYSEHLKFLLDPVNYDYSLVDTNDYMWQNFIFSKEYKKYFVENKSILLSEELKNVFASSLETKIQQKIVYGLLLDDEDLRQF